jgi:hypothetical protein
MKVFYSASLHGLSRSDDLYKIIKTIPSHLAGLENVSLVINLEDDNNTNPKNVSNILSSLRTADAFIGEMSVPSQILGFELAYASLHFIPCLYLYHENYSVQKPSPLVTENPARKLWAKKYNNDNIDSAISGFFAMVARQMETSRTSFMSTKEIDEFLDKESDTKGIPKGELIRQALAEKLRQKNEP